MLFYYSKYICNCVIVLTFIIIGCAGYAFRVNERRKDDDPKKKRCHPAAIFLAPITLPFLLFFWIFLFILRSLLYGLFLILFTIALVAIRKPFLLIWLDRIATWIGEKLLEANTFLIRIFLPQWDTQPA
ncbi:MAG: hypothetical protein C3F07_07435 [Anaerolineales bacterium]|nr:MAG: hypothetical protein C3F07_07435 [Anaerolineales bacterium]